MARIVGRRAGSGAGSDAGQRFSELVVFALVIAAIVLGVRYYINYRHSAGYALEEFLGDVQGGSVTGQYELVSDADKRDWCPSKQAYERRAAGYAHGYTDRVENVRIGETKIDPRSPDTATVKATVTLLAPLQGEKLYQNGPSHDYTDTYTMQKSTSGKWTVVLEKSTTNMLKEEPNATSTY